MTPRARTALVVGVVAVGRQMGITPFALLLASLPMGCAACRESSTEFDSTDGVTTIRYALEPFRTFDIEGTSVAGIGLDELPEAVRRHQQEHPGAVYEVYAEVKSGSELSDEIIAAIRSTGVVLEHYWAPVSFVDLDSASGKYGLGHVDILGPSRRE